VPDPYYLLIRNEWLLSRNLLEAFDDDEYFR
jgi:hypothetical protein